MMDMSKLMKSLEVIVSRTELSQIEFEHQALGEEAKPEHAKLFSFLAEQANQGLSGCQVSAIVHPASGGEYEMEIEATIGLDKAQKLALQALYES